MKFHCPATRRVALTRSRCGRTWPGTVARWRRRPARSGWSRHGTGSGAGRAQRLEFLGVHDPVRGAGRQRPRVARQPGQLRPVVRHVGRSVVGQLVAGVLFGGVLVLRRRPQLVVISVVGASSPSGRSSELTVQRAALRSRGGIARWPVPSLRQRVLLVPRMPSMSSTIAATLLDLRAPASRASDRSASKKSRLGPCACHVRRQAHRPAPRTARQAQQQRRQVRTCATPRRCPRTRWPG